jgi:hypothetical protein
MAASDYGYYRSDGIQNSGTALRQGNGNAYIYNSAGQIYPRQVTETDVTFADSGKQYLHQTCRSGYNGSNEKSAWRTDKAYQGYYNGSQGSSEQAVGHFFSSDGTKISVGDGNVTDFEVTYVKIVMHRGTGGWNKGYSGEGHLRFSNLSSSYKNGEYRGMRYSDIDMDLVNGYDYVFDIPAIGSSVTIERSGSGDALCQFIKNFINNSSAQSLALYNGENAGQGGYAFSYHYAAFDSFEITVKGNRTVQL